MGPIDGLYGSVWKIVGVLLALATTTTTLTVSATSAAPPQHPPNILILLTDDQDVVLGSFDHMPHVKALLQDQGKTFVHGMFVHTPICCPSRSSILTGKYLHNLQVVNNTRQGNCDGPEWRHRHEPHTFAVRAQQAGYTTAYTGKYLNMYDGSSSSGHNNNNNNKNSSNSPTIPVGWDHWWGLVGNSRYYNYTMIQGEGPRRRRHGRTATTTAGATSTAEPQRVQYGDSYPDDYLPNVMNQKIIQWISEELTEPWLIVAAWPTPHGPFTPPPWAQGTMSDVFPPQTPNYNASSHYMQQKHWLMRQFPPIQPSIATQVNKYYQMRLESLKSIDVHVAELVKVLQNKGNNNNNNNNNNNSTLLDRTVILYTSDNGFQFGQHRMSMDKRHLYEHDIRVPFVARGPGIPPNTTSTAMIASIDIGPTLLDIARVDATDPTVSTMDGQSFWKIAQNKEEEEEVGRESTGHSSGPRRRRHDLLISYHGEGSSPCGLSECPYPWNDISWMPDSWNNTYHCVRTLHERENSIFCLFDDDESFVEYYDLTTNPYQLDNDASRLDALQLLRYKTRLQELLKCSGESCRNEYGD